MKMTYEYKDHPLPVLISARVRLNEDQRKKLKEAYYGIKNSIAPTERTNENGLTVSTPYATPDLDKQLGMSALGRPLLTHDVGYSFNSA